MAGGARLLLPPLTAITMINRDQNTHSPESQRVGRTLRWCESSAATVNTNPSDVRVWICACGFVFVRLHPCVRGWRASSEAIQCPPTDVTAVFSRLSAGPADACVAQTCGGRRHGRERLTGSHGHFSACVPCECCLCRQGFLWRGATPLLICLSNFKA